MRAPLVIPALLLLLAVVAGRDYGGLDAALLAAIAIGALGTGRSRARAVAAIAVAAGLLLGAWRGAPPQVTAAIASARIQGIVTSRVPQPWGDSFELLADGTRFSAASHERVTIGERLTLAGRLEPFDEPRNPEEPSARELARERGLAGRLTGGRILARAPPDPYDLRTVPARVREWASATLRRALAEPDATILAGMLYGERGALPAALRAEFQDTGTVHVLVTAGLHLGVVAALVAFVLSGAGRIPASLGAIPIVWVYAILSGAHVPSLRAATMVTVALIARAAGERALSLNTLALAAIVVGAIWPAWVGGVSFALSFSCVTAIVLFAEAIAAALVPLRLPGVLREAIALTLATQLGVWPLGAATFLVIAPYAVLANLVVVPVVGVALVLGIGVIATAVIPVAGSVLARIESWPLAWIEQTVHLVAQLPFAHVVATPPPLWTIALYDLALILAALMLGRERDQMRADAGGADS